MDWDPCYCCCWQDRVASARAQAQQNALDEAEDRRYLADLQANDPGRYAAELDWRKNDAAIYARQAAPSGTAVSTGAAAAASSSTPAPPPAPGADDEDDRAS